MLFKLNKAPDLNPANDKKDVLAELQAENKMLREDNKRMSESIATIRALALEFGYKQCEKGENIQAAFINYNKIINP